MTRPRASPDSGRRRRPSDRGQQLPVRIAELESGQSPGRDPGERVRILLVWLDTVRKLRAVQHQPDCQVVVGVRDFGDRLTRLEVGQEQLRDELRGVAEGVTLNGERLDRANDRIDGVDGLVRELAGVKPASD